jgi:hypothetical protein
MNLEIKRRKIELERLSNVSAIEALILELEVGESRVYKIKDIESYQWLRTRINRIRNSIGLRYSSEIKINYVIITRLEND